MKQLKHSVILILLSCLLSQNVYANELAIWDRLQGTNPKGYVLLLRHTLAPGVGDPENFKLNDCSTQRNLSSVGREDAKAVGEWLKRREIKVARVESSRWCRARPSVPGVGCLQNTGSRGTGLGFGAPYHLAQYSCVFPDLCMS